MKVNLKAILVNVSGEPLKNPAKGNKPMTVEDIIFGSILSVVPEDNAEVKYSKYDIFKKIRDTKITEDGKEKNVNFTAEEVVLIKKCVGKFQPPLIMGQCFDILNK